MSLEENKAKMRLFIEEAFNKGNLAVLDEVIAPEYVHHTGFGEVKGLDGWKQTVNIMRNAFPDLKDTILSMVAEGNMVAFTLRAQGTLKGEFLGMSPTGKHYDLTEAIFVRFAGGKAVEGWTYNDSLTFYRQLGISPPGS
jgi:predicted ester cyclase